LPRLGSRVRIPSPAPVGLSQTISRKSGALEMASARQSFPTELGGSSPVRTTRSVSEPHILSAAWESSDLLDKLFCGENQYVELRKSVKSCRTDRLSPALDRMVKRSRRPRAYGLPPSLSAREPRPKRLVGSAAKCKANPGAAATRCSHPRTPPTAERLEPERINVGPPRLMGRGSAPALFTGRTTHACLGDNGR
jgi:hypothetical protein